MTSLRFLTIYWLNYSTSLELIDGRAEWPHGADELKNVEVFYARTRRRNKIACMFVTPCGANAHFTLLFSHGNAVDLGQMCSFYYGLGYRLGCNVFSYDYSGEFSKMFRVLKCLNLRFILFFISGYGCSSGRPSEKNLYADIAAAVDILNEKYHIPPEQVILYGQSIGTVPSVDLASSDKYNVAALILHSPLMSGVNLLVNFYLKLNRGKTQRLSKSIIIVLFYLIHLLWPIFYILIF